MLPGGGELEDAEGWAVPALWEWELEGLLFLLRDDPGEVDFFLVPEELPL